MLGALSSSCDGAIRKGWSRAVRPGSAGKQRPVTFQAWLMTEARVGALSSPTPCPQAHRQRVLVVLICLSVAPSLNVSVLMVSLSLTFISHGQVEPMATWNHFP